MKTPKLVALVIISICSHSLFAQDETETFIGKGSWLVGGNLSLALAVGETYDLTTFSVTPMGGYFVGNKLAVGLSTSYQYYKGSSNSQAFSVQPFLRYYFLQKKLAPYGEVAYGGGWTQNEVFDSFLGETVTVKSSSSFYRVAAGLNYFVSKNVALDGNLRYSRNNDFDYGIVSFNVGLQFFIR
jgi:opacity protein-like surface antigen